MRIGLFTDSYPPYINGVSTSVVCLQKALEKKGHQVFIVTVNAEKMGYKYENDNKIIRIPGIPIGIYDYRLTGIYPLRAVRKVMRWNLDIIHSHTEFGVGTFARIMANELDIPLIHTYHTMYEDYIYYITKGYFDKSSKKVVEYITKFYCDKTASELIVPTKKTYDFFKEKYKVKRDIHIVPTGLEIERFYPQNLNKTQVSELKKELGIKKDDFVILFVGRMGKEKNLEFLLDVTKKLVKNYPNVKLLLVGSGPDEDHFKAYAKKLKITDNVIFTGKVPFEKTPNYFACANIFSTASTTETQGLTVIEALAASLPVVCINDESFNSTIVDDLNGYLFENKKECYKQIESLINDKDKVKNLKVGAKNTAHKHSAKYYAEQVLDVYKIALSKKKVTLKTRINRLMKRGKLWKKS